MSKKLSSLILLTVSPRENMPIVESKLLKIKNIKTIYKILGRYDICIEVEVDCEEELGSVIHYISQIEGVESLSTFVISGKINMTKP